jgi:hypothetical protein
MNNKDYKLVAVIGRTGTGKTTFLKKYIVDKFKNNIIIDFTNAWEVFGIEEIQDFESLKSYKGGTYRLFKLVLYEELEEKAIEVLKLKSNYNLIIDDADVRIFRMAKKYYKDLFFAYRHLKINVFIVCHSIQDIPLEVRRVLDYMVLFQISDNKYKIQNKLDKYQFIIYNRNELIEKFNF